MTKISKFFKSRTFACGRSAPRSILCAPNLLGSNQGSCFTAIVHEIPVHVRRLPTAFHHCVLYHWRHVTVHSWRRYRHVSTVSEWVGGAPFKKTTTTVHCTFTDRNASIPAFTQTFPGSPSHEAIPAERRSCFHRVLNALKVMNVRKWILRVWNSTLCVFLPPIAHGCNGVSKRISIIDELSVKNLSCRAAWLSFIRAKEETDLSLTHHHELLKCVTFII